MPFRNRGSPRLHERCFLAFDRPKLGTTLVFPLTHARAPALLVGKSTSRLQMNIREALFDEHSKRQTMAIVNFIGGDPVKFGELMSIFFEGEYCLTQRAAWPMSCSVERWPELVYPYLEQLIAQLTRDDIHNAVRRNVVRLLQFIEIPEELLGRVYSTCIDLIDDVREAVAIRAFAVTAAERIARTEPDLRNELRLVVRKHLAHSSAAFRSRAKSIL